MLMVAPRGSTKEATSRRAPRRSVHSRFCLLYTSYYRNFNIEGTTQNLLRNNHAVLVCGYDATTQYYYIADPYNIDDRYHDYFYWISADVLDPLYMVRQHAVAIE